MATSIAACLGDAEVRAFHVGLARFNNRCKTFMAWTALR